MDGKLVRLDVLSDFGNLYPVMIPKSSLLDVADVNLSFHADYAIVKFTLAHL